MKPNEERQIGDVLILRINRTSVKVKSTKEVSCTNYPKSIITSFHCSGKGTSSISVEGGVFNGDVVISNVCK